LYSRIAEATALGVPAATSGPATWLGRLRATNAGSGVAARALIVAGLACACPPLFAGWAALAGTALVAAAAALALTLAPRAAAADVAR